MTIIIAAIYDVQHYDRHSFKHAGGGERIRWSFHNCRMSAETAATVEGPKAVGVFVSDHVDAACLDALAGLGARLLTLRCAVFNNVDLTAAKSLGIAVIRVPDYSPHAVAEHTVGLLLALKRKVHRAYNRVRVLNFPLNGLVGFDVCCKTLGIIGRERIGRVTAQVIGGCDAQVLAHDPAPDTGWMAQHGIQSNLSPSSGFPTSPLMMSLSSAGKAHRSERWSASSPARGGRARCIYDCGGGLPPFHPQCQDRQAHPCDARGPRYARHGKPGRERLCGEAGHSPRDTANRFDRPTALRSLGLKPATN